MQTPGFPLREADLVPLGWEWETPTWGLVEPVDLYTPPSLLSAPSSVKCKVVFF